MSNSNTENNHIHAIKVSNTYGWQVTTHVVIVREDPNLILTNYKLHDLSIRLSFRLIINNLYKVNTYKNISRFHKRVKDSNYLWLKKIFMQ